MSAANDQLNPFDEDSFDWFAELALATAARAQARIAKLWRALEQNGWYVPARKPAGLPIGKEASHVG